MVNLSAVAHRLRQHSFVQHAPFHKMEAERKKDAFYVMLGGLLGATTFGLLNPILKPVLNAPFNFGEVRLPTLLGISPLTMALELSASLLALTWLLPDRVGERTSAVSAPEATKAA